MKNVGMTVALISVVMVTIFGMSRCERKVSVKEETILAHIKNIQDLQAIFPQTAQEVADKTDEYIERMKKGIQALIAVPDEERTFENTAFALDRLGIVTNMDVFAAACSVLKNVSPDEVIRNAARDALLKMVSFQVDWISANVELYNAFKAYALGNFTKEKLRDDQRYFVQETMKDFKRAGLELPLGELEKIKKIKKELANLSLSFSSNIAQDNRTIEVDRASLAGMDDDFINALKKTDDGNYILGVDYPTVLPIMSDCTIQDTRKRLSRAFNNRAYPVNKPVLEQIIAYRDELANILDFKSYAHLNLASQMMKSPERAKQVLQKLLVKLNKKADQEFKQFTAKLPASVTLTADGKMNSWDTSFVLNQYKKEHFAVDEKKIAEYFQLEHTLATMFELYEQFFGLRFQEVSSNGGFWHPEVKLVKVYTEKGDKLLAYLLLDLHPRDNKFSHAAHIGVVSALKDGWPSVSFVVANFPKSTATKPSLLKRAQVNTLFHEFGHAIHSILGRTHLASFAGTSVKQDFVEAPSQMLEEWLWDTKVLQIVSKHYQTGESLPLAMIEKITALKQFDRGSFWQRQTMLASLALAYFKPGAQKDLDAIWQELSSISPHVAHDPEGHFYTSWGHLTGYGAWYYGYIWSKVLAADIFDFINKKGLFRPEAGDRYVDIVLGAGGSKDPEDLMTEFLGRESNDTAFSKAMGLN